MAKKTLVRLTMILMLPVALIALASPAKAGCEYGYLITTTYYGWPVCDGSYLCAGTTNQCTQPLVGPQINWEEIGGTRYSECNDSFESWGDTTSCTGPENTQVDYQRCGLICS